MGYFKWHEKPGYWGDVVRQRRARILAAAARLPIVRPNVWVVARR